MTQTSPSPELRLAQDAWDTRDPDRISVRFEYESRDVHGECWRSQDNEHWELDEQSGLMRRRNASIDASRAIR